MDQEKLTELVKYIDGLISSLEDEYKNNEIVGKNPQNKLNHPMADAFYRFQCTSINIRREEIQGIKNEIGKLLFII